MVTDASSVLFAIVIIRWCTVRVQYTSTSRLLSHWDQRRTTWWNPFQLLRLIPTMTWWTSNECVRQTVCYRSSTNRI